MKIRAVVAMQVVLDCDLFQSEVDAEAFLRSTFTEQLPEAPLVARNEELEEFPVGLHVGSMVVKAEKPEPKK